MTQQDSALEKAWNPGWELVSSLPSFVGLTDTQKTYAAELFNETLMRDEGPISMAEADETLLKVKEQALTID